MSGSNVDANVCVLKSSEEKKRVRRYHTLYTYMFKKRRGKKHMRAILTHLRKLKLQCIYYL